MSTSNDARGPVGWLADEFLARCKRGERPTIREYCDRHPELAEEIRDVFAAVLMVEDLQARLRQLPRARWPALTARRQEPPANRSATTASCARSAGAAWASSTRPNRRPWAGDVALKVLPAGRWRRLGADPRFQREAKAAARLHHTNIVPVFEVGPGRRAPCTSRCSSFAGLGLDVVHRRSEAVAAGRSRKPVPRRRSRVAA